MQRQAVANLEIIERENLVVNAHEVGAYFQKRMHETFDDHPLVGEVRGEGLLCALEFMADKEQKQRFDPGLKVGPRIAAACANNDLIARAMPHGDILGYAPPLVITRDEIDLIVDRSKRAVDQVHAELGKT